MGELWKMIAAYQDEYGSSVPWIAKQMETDAQTLYNWRDRGIKQLPQDRLLRALARVIRQPYERVLTAVLIDTQRWDPATDGKQAPNLPKEAGA